MADDSKWIVVILLCLIVVGGLSYASYLLGHKKGIEQTVAFYDTVENTSLELAADILTVVTKDKACVEYLQNEIMTNTSLYIQLGTKLSRFERFFGEVE